VGSAARVCCRAISETECALPRQRSLIIKSQTEVIVRSLTKVLITSQREVLITSQPQLITTNQTEDIITNQTEFFITDLFTHHYYESIIIFFSLFALLLLLPSVSAVHKRCLCCRHTAALQQAPAGKAARGMKLAKGGQEVAKSGQEVAKLGQEEAKAGQEEAKAGQEQGKPKTEDPVREYFKKLLSDVKPNLEEWGYLKQLTEFLEKLRASPVLDGGGAPIGWAITEGAPAAAVPAFHRLCQAADPCAVAGAVEASYVVLISSCSFIRNFLVYMSV
jgi:hypothetical protein